MSPGDPFDWERHGLIRPATSPSIPGGPQSVTGVLEDLRGTSPDAEALVGSGGRFTWAELDGVVNQAARALSTLGVGRFDRVAVSLPNDVDIVVAFLAVMRIGAIWVGVNRQLAVPEKDYLLEDSGSRLLIAESEASARAGVDTAALDLAEWQRLVEAQTSAGWDGVACDPFEPAAISYTSGTTGRPKGAVHSQHNLLCYGAAAREANLYGSGLHAGVQLPLTILNLFVIQVLHAFQNGGKCVCVQAKGPVELAEVINREQVAHMASVPTIYHDLLREPLVADDALASVRLAEIGGTNVPVELLREFRKRFGIEPRVSYGMTEAPAAVTRAAEGQEPVAGLVGFALPHIGISVLDESGVEVASGQEGEISVGPATSGPLAGVYTPTLGYWGRPAESASALRGGRYRTGDLGVLDEDGRLFVRGRVSELIIRGGANIHPAEVERVLGMLDGVGASAVLGVPDDRLGQRVVAVVEVVSEGSVTTEQLVEHCSVHLAGYKVPERFEFVSRLPRNTMQKVLKTELVGLFT